MDDVYNLRDLPQKASQAKKSNKKLVQRLKKINPRKLDRIVHELHAEVFEEIDCLKCGNCCRSISPHITDKDIQRLAGSLKMKPSYFSEQFVKIDEDSSYGFNQSPCPFLGEDNYCAVYTLRPKACADYPLTDRKRFYQALDLSLKNTVICPAVYEIFEWLKVRGY
ncbi:MAG: YkgJ family cysteine cluster protein [Bacteroidales bacterium]|nr:YkgJ family cysteine cluster protein [Bacteroidales bacterium]MCF8334312.1 YkgJ family cysteine cluster protein [Bacteroidales bacterium]